MTTIKKYFWHLITLLCFSAFSFQTQAAVCTYKIDKEWNRGFTAEISITNDGSSVINGWKVDWSYKTNSVTGCC
jgi:Cellulose binding domain